MESASRVWFSGSVRASVPDWSAAPSVRIRRSPWSTICACAARSSSASFWISANPLRTCPSAGTQACPAACRAASPNPAAPAAGKDCTPVGRSDNGSHPLVRPPPRRWALVVPDRQTVGHPLTRPGNPDASLSAFWRGSGAGARRDSDVLGGSAGSDLRQREGRYGVPLQRNRQDSRYCPDRTGGRSPPGGGSGRSGTGVQCSPSAQKADEDLIVGQKRETVNRPCFARHLGVRYRGDVQNRDPVSHLSQRLPLSTPLPTFCHPPWIRDLICKITRPGAYSNVSAQESTPVFRAQPAPDFLLPYHHAGERHGTKRCH